MLFRSNDTATTEIYTEENTLSLHDALPISWASVLGYLTLEIFGSLTRLITDTDELYRAHVHTVMLGMGFDPDLTTTASAHRATTDPGG